MASTVIMIGTNGPDPACQDGDPLEVFNDRRTLIDFAQRIIQPANKQELKGFTPNGPHKNFLERVSQYRFEHISKDVIKRTDIKKKLVLIILIQLLILSWGIMIRKD